MSLPHSLFLVIFGASGDLTRRKLMPALIKIHNGKRFPEHFAIIGCARTAYTDETYRAYLKEELIKFGFLTKEEMETLDDFLSTVHYQSMDPADETDISLDCMPKEVSTTFSLKETATKVNITVRQDSLMDIPLQCHGIWHWNSAWA